MLLEEDFKELHGQAVVGAKEAFGGGDFISDGLGFLSVPDNSHRLYILHKDLPV